jgi:peptidyl-prolyl cis-trans isomerase B (cyclophilin B)
MNMRIPIIIASCLLIGAGCENTITTPRTEAPEAAQSGDVSQLSVDSGIPQEESAEATEAELPTDASPMIDRSNLSFPGVLPKDQTDKRVRIKTNKGEILIELLPDEGPNAASNFVYLITNRYYDGLTFHRYIENFVIQGGDPTGTGYGGPGYAFADDPVRPADENPYMEMRNGKYTYLKGTVAMANSGPNTNGSQFFIMNADAPMVGPDYSIFGRVIEGIDVVVELREGDVMESVTLEAKE